MELIDEEGRLFGVVNVIDALAVLLVLAVVVAGIALVDPFGGTASRSENATRYATIEIQDQPSYIAELFAEGDVMSLPGTEQTVTVTDVFITPTPGEKVSVSLRVRVNGSLQDSPNRVGQTFLFGGRTIQQGGPITVETGEYTANGSVTRLSPSDPNLDTCRTPIELTATLSPTTARRISPGDNVTIAGRQIAEITDVYVGPGTNPDNRHVRLIVALETLQRSGGLSYGGQDLVLDGDLSLTTDEYRISGRIDSIDADGIPRTTTDVAIETTVSRRLADEIAVGDEYRLANSTVATVRSIDAYPAGNQERTRVVLGLELATVGVDGDQFFGDTRVQLGSTIPLETDAYRLSGTVTNRGSLAPPGETTTKTVVVEVSDVAPEFADGIAVGMTEGGDATTARIVDKRVEPATVILTSESGEIFQREHPRNVDVYLTVEVQVRDTRTGLRFHSRSLQEGTTITLDFRTISVRGTVIEIE